MREQLRYSPFLAEVMVDDMLNSRIRVPFRCANVARGMCVRTRGCGAPFAAWHGWTCEGLRAHVRVLNDTSLRSSMPEAVPSSDGKAWAGMCAP